MEVRFDRRMPSLDRLDQTQSGARVDPVSPPDRADRARQGWRVYQDQHRELHHAAIPAVEDIGIAGQRKVAQRVEDPQMMGGIVWLGDRLAADRQLRANGLWYILDEVPIRAASMLEVDVEDAPELGAAQVDARPADRQNVAVSLAVPSR